MKTISMGSNATSRFLAKHWATLRPHLLGLLNSRSYAVRESGFADDALNELVVCLIKDDRLAPYIDGDVGVQLGVLSVWALQKLYGVMRARGVDVLTRFHYGMKTTKDRKAGVFVPTMGSEEETLEVLDEGSTQDSFTMGGELSTLIKKNVNKEDAYILFLTADGMSRKEVAEEVGKTEFQVARSLFKSRQKLRPILSSQI